MNKQELLLNLKEVDNETEIRFWILDNLFTRQELEHYLKNLRGLE